MIIGMENVRLRTMTEIRSEILLSVCIPLYNWDVRSLVGRLSGEISAKKYEDRVEVIVMDDSSTDAVIKDSNRGFCAELVSPTFRYSELGKNVGRARIRNLLAQEAAGMFLLFVDADVMPDGADFLEIYLTHALENTWDAVCGAISYRNRTMTGKEYDFYFYFGNRVEVKPVEVRQRAPWRYLWTSNIMVRRSVFLQMPFDERFTGYGYEDTEWGIRMSRQHKVLHIDDTVSHLGLVTKETLYRKMRMSIENYALLAHLHPEAFTESDVYKVVKLLRTLSGPLLRIMDTALERMFFRMNSNRLCLIMFQLNKAVLLARHFRNRHSGVAVT